MYKLVTCKEYVALRKEKLKQEVSEFSRQPRLIVVQIGEDKASTSYIRSKSKLCEELGINMSHCQIKNYEEFSQEGLETLVSDFNKNENVDGIIIQLPVPQKYDIEAIQKCISPEKDVDGFRRDSFYSPCTPKGIIDYLKSNDVNFVGKNVVVVGRSKIVGQPLVNMLINEGSTVTCCNSKTKDIRFFTHNAHIVISAIGQAQFFDDSYFKHNQIIVDVGINRDKNGKLCGDVCRDVVNKAKLLTPVPGGVGLLTTLSLMENTINAYKINGGVNKCQSLL